MKTSRQIEENIVNLNKNHRTIQRRKEQLERIGNSMHRNLNGCINDYNASVKKCADKVGDGLHGTRNMESLESAILGKREKDDWSDDALQMIHVYINREINRCNEELSKIQTNLRKARSNLSEAKEEEKKALEGGKST